MSPVLEQDLDPGSLELLQAAMGRAIAFRDLDEVAARVGLGGRANVLGNDG